MQISYFIMMIDISYFIITTHRPSRRDPRGFHNQREGVVFSISEFHITIKSESFSSPLAARGRLILRHLPYTLLGFGEYVARRERVCGRESLVQIFKIEGQGRFPLFRNKIRD